MGLKVRRGKSTKVSGRLLLPLIDSAPESRFPNPGEQIVNEIFQCCGYDFGLHGSPTRVLPIAAIQGPKHAKRSEFLHGKEGRCRLLCQCGAGIDNTLRKVEAS